MPPPRSSAAAQKAPDVIEREDGNARFKRGEFVPAIKAYTRAIAHNPDSHLSYSNRAMCYLKLREFSKAVTDASLALRLDPHHVKSLLRRATASNALGRHRDALSDLDLAHALEPGNKQVAADLRNTRELRRTAIRRAPRRRIHIACKRASASAAGGGAAGAGAAPAQPVSDVSALD